MKTLLLALSAALAVMLAGCGGSLTKSPVQPDPVPQTVITQSGLQYQDIKVGIGKQATASDMVTVNYILYLTNDTKVESTMNPGGAPVEITLGRKEITAGFDEGVEGMSVGGHRRLVVPPEIGYGDTGKPPLIPGGVSVVYYVELVSIGPWTTLPDGLKYTELVEGTGAEVAATDTVSVKYTAYFTSGKKINSMDTGSTPVVITLGMKEKTAGMDEGVTGMKVGGKRRLWIPADLAYGSAGHSPDIPSNSILIVDVEVVNIREWTTLPDGLKYIDLTVGTGASPATYDNASVNYTGWLTDGTKFDSSTSGTPFLFTVGTGQVIAGWDEGIMSMKVGGKRRLMIPSALAYGDTVHGSIPAGSTLVFDNELVQVAAPVTTASGLKYHDYLVGTGASPSTGDRVFVNYTGWLTDGTQFDASNGVPIDFLIGTGAVIAGWDEGIMSMKVGGRRKLIIPPALGYGSAGNPPKIPGDAWLVFQTELMNVTGP